MKSSLLVILVAILAFAAAWFLKPVPASITPPLVHKSQPLPNPVPSPDLAISPAPGSSINPSLKNPGKTSVDPIQSAKSRDSAKLLRLAEALKLTAAQQTSIQEIIAAAQALENPENKPLDPAQQLELAATTGGNIEESLDNVFTPEQAAAFQALRDRVKENSIEASAQAQLSPIAKQIDLTPDQRARVLQSLRAEVAAKIEARPGPLDLAISSSVLPIGPAAISADSIDNLLLMSEQKNLPDEQQATFIEHQQRNLEKQLDLYQPILTPAQHAQLKGIIDERKQNIDRVNDLIR